MSQSLRILILEDDPYDAELAIASLEEAGYSCKWERVESQAEFQARLASPAPGYDLILADYNLPSFDGLTALELLLERSLDLPFILVSGTVGEETAIESLKAGATDYVLKDRLSRLGPVVTRALHEKGERQRRQRAEEELRKLSRAVEQSPSLVMITDTDGNVEYVNPRFTQITGYTAQEIVGHNPRLLKSGQTTSEEYEQLWQTITDGGEWHGELYNKKKNGEFYWVSVCISPIRDSAGNITHFLSIQEDITERKQLEEQLRLAQKMEAIGRLTAGIAHDFNNLLTIINGFANLVLQELSYDDPLREMVDKISGSGQHATNLVRQLLTFSRKQIVELKVLDLNDVVRHMDKMLERIIGEDIDLKTSLSPGLWSVKADRAQLEQVIVNLVINARDAMPRGGRLTIGTDNVGLSDGYVAGRLGMQPGEYVLLTISDTGVGMSKEVRARIFEPFFTTKGMGQGTGLGLSTVYGIVKQSGGNILVYSEEGQGTTFKIYLPQSKETHPSRSGPETPAEMPPGSETILLVEDAEGVRNLASSVLGMQGYTVLEAQDGQEALQRVANSASPIHLLLTDVVMPGISGKALAEQLIQSQPNLKVLYMSGYTDNAIAHHGVLDPGTAFLQKPFGPVALARKVREVLDTPCGPGAASKKREEPC
jgi:two-component system cell cycle sensor histidine kinase/response regulator CckA